MELNHIFSTEWPKVWEIALCALGVYVVVILLTRIFGKRSLSKMSSFDFAMTVAVGSIMASTAMSPDTSLTEGATALLVLYFFQTSVAFLRRYRLFYQVIDNSPLLLMDGSEILHENLKQARVTVNDLRYKLRQANVTHLSQVRAVVFETSGEISVLTGSGKNFDTWLLDNVQDKKALSV